MLKTICRQKSTATVEQLIDRAEANHHKVSKQIEASFGSKTANRRADRQSRLLNTVYSCVCACVCDHNLDVKESKVDWQLRLTGQEQVQISACLCVQKTGLRPVQERTETGGADENNALNKPDIELGSSCRQGTYTRNKTRVETEKKSNFGLCYGLRGRNDQKAKKAPS